MSKSKPSGPPGGISPGPTCGRCQHTRNQHTTNGCVYSEMRGSKWWECKCKVTYNEIY